jgi:hypothetical protein
MGAILLFPCIIWSGGYEVANLPKVIFLSVVTLVLLGTLVWNSFEDGISFSKNEGVIVAVAVLFFGFGYFWNSGSVDALYGSMDRYMGWTSYFLAVVFAGCAYFSRIPRDRILSSIVAVSVGLAMVGILQKLGIF